MTGFLKVSAGHGAQGPEEIGLSAAKEPVIPRSISPN
jgi:hypothetical protein